MAKAKLLTAYAFFVRDAAPDAARETKPVSFTGYGIGTVDTCTQRSPTEPIRVERPIGGKWRVWDVIQERDDLEFTLEISELTEQSWKLLMNTDTTLSGGGANFTPGSAGTAQGWLQLQYVDENGDRNNTLEIYANLRIATQTVGRGKIMATIEVVKLYSSENSGTLENITY